MTQGTSGVNVARQALMAVGFPVDLAAATIDRECASGLSPIAARAAQIATGDSRIVLCGGVESISLVQNEHMNRFRDRDPRVEPAYRDTTRRPSRPQNSWPNSPELRQSVKTNPRF
ncbi:hypothetical protein [Phyllobacterium endophyticum]|uniref:thiolase family protein n=1 Tax=Phyllobacterium endophyticum TaxID=1149773 RepID=UPI0011C98C23|nr:hypothetical protein FVA77_04645 [Phyllobacterium endophyticum]